MYQLRARYYHLKSGRFVSVDPFEGSATRPVTLHRYLYAADDPVNRIDPSGMDDDLASLNVNMEIQGELHSVARPSYNQALQQVRQKFGRQGIDTVKNLRNLRNPGEETHHLIERRFLDNPNYSTELERMFANEAEMPGINLTRAEHQEITNAWRNALGRARDVNYNASPSIQKLIEAVDIVYKDYPAFANASRMFLEPLLIP